MEKKVSGEIYGLMLQGLGVQFGKKMLHNIWAVLYIKKIKKLIN
jgi:hypothetical protein